LMFAALIALPHFSVSSEMNVPKLAGVFVNTTPRLCYTALHMGVFGWVGASLGGPLLTFWGDSMRR
jgi:hypothetical protein